MYIHINIIDLSQMRWDHILLWNSCFLLAACWDLRCNEAGKSENKGAHLRAVAAAAGRRGSSEAMDRATSCNWPQSVMLRSCALVHAPVTFLSSWPARTHHKSLCQACNCGRDAAFPCYLPLLLWLHLSVISEYIIGC